MSQENATMIYPPSTRAKMLIYSMPRFGIELVVGMIDFTLLFLYTDAYKLNGLLSGIATLLGKIAIAIAQFVLGWVSDHTNTRWGRRKPYLFIITPLLGIFFFLLLVPGLILGSNPDQITLFLWFAIFNMLTQACYGVTAIYHSWTAEQFQVKDRPKVSSYQNSFNFLGAAVIAIFSFVVLTSIKSQLQAHPDIIPVNFLYSIIIFSVILVGLLYVCAIYMPKENTPIYKTPLLTDLKTILKNKNFINATLMQGIGSFGWAMISAFLLGYTQLVLRLQGINYIIVAGIFILTLIISVFGFRKMVSTRGKKKTLLIIFLIAICASPISLIGLLPQSTTLYFAIIFVIGVSIGYGGWQLFPYFIYPDLSEDDEKRTGELKAGIYTGFPSILLNIFQGFSDLLSGWLISLPLITNVSGATPFSMGYILWGPISSVFLIIALLFTRKHLNLDYQWENK
jgi:GPH family glycoside/pentoside/hexuronide:cation symporter